MALIIGNRLKLLREAKKLSQGDLRERTGLLPCYTSRVENGHTVPSLETLEKFAQALEVPMYHLMYDGEEPPARKEASKPEANSWEHSQTGRRLMEKLIPLIAKMSQPDRNLVLLLAGRVAGKRDRKARALERRSGF